MPMTTARRSTTESATRAPVRLEIASVLSLVSPERRRRSGTLGGGAVLRAISSPALFQLELAFEDRDGDVAFGDETDEAAKTAGDDCAHVTDELRPLGAFRSLQCLGHVTAQEQQRE